MMRTKQLTTNKKIFFTWKAIFFTALFLSILPFTIGQSFFGGGSYTGVGSYQYYQPNFNQYYSSTEIGTYWPVYQNLRDNQCNATQSDFVVTIPPGGCSPTVVRSDLLAEQNVPVFCQLQALQVNPLIKVSSINSISFTGEKPEGVSGIAFHPARAASRTYTSLLGNPTVQNIGYVVIILSRDKIEDGMEKWIAGNLTATIRYDAEEAYGVGRADYYLEQLSDSEWEEQFARNTFWKGRGYVRLASVGQNSAVVELMDSKDHVFREISLQEGKTSELIYFPGFYCMAGLKLRLNDIETPADSVLLSVDGTEQWVRTGSKILNNRCSVGAIAITGEDETGNNYTSGTVKIHCPGQTSTLEIIRNAVALSNDPITDPIASQSFTEGVLAAQELVEIFPFEETSNADVTYAEEALLAQIDIARSLRQHETQRELMDLYIETFPGSPAYEIIRAELDDLGIYDYSHAYESMYVVDRYHTIGARDFIPEPTDAASADLRISGIDYANVIEGDEIALASGTIIINTISPNDVKVSFTGTDEGGETLFDNERIDEGTSETVGVYEVFVQNVNIEEFAHISLIPEIQRTRTDADFTFRIGVEQRNLPITPEKAQEKIENLEESIEEWNDITDTLGTTISAWKGACFATSAALMIKNTVSGFSGEGLARQKVMAHYKEECAKRVATGEFSTQTACYFDDTVSQEIEASVEAMATSLGNVNGQLETSIDKHKEPISGSIFGEETIFDQESYVADLQKQLPSDWRWEGEGETLLAEDLHTSEQIKAALLFEQVKSKGDSVAANVAQKELDSTLGSVALFKKANSAQAAAQQTIADKFGSGTATPKIQSITTTTETRLKAYSGEVIGTYPVIKNALSIEDETTPIQFLNDENGQEYLLILAPHTTDDNRKGVTATYKLSASNTWEYLSANEFNLQFVGSGSEGSCFNSWPQNTAKIHYYESGPNKGLPAIVPFDLQEGWYALVPNTGGSAFEGSTQGYQASGLPSNFYICNIGANGLMEKARGDDLCQSFSIHTAGAVDTFISCPSLDNTDVSSLYSRAQEAIKQASNQYGKGSTASIFNQIIGIGVPESATGDLECTDFMSPQDCKLLFNVCDPVICPSSRCDLGGRLPVSDVIQTGVVGGVLMCLPNAQEGIYVPVCLSGIHAGLENYVSLLESHQACLEERVATGQYVGICDQTTAIYTCQLFWEQASFLTDYILPKAIGSLYGGSASGTKGGGEYLFVQNAFDNLDKSINFFKNTYAENAFRAFELSNVQEIGTEVCRAFIGTSLPTSAEAIDSLLAPESPPQFYAEFSEQVFTDATVPATSQYKVYYHIFAGNNFGVQYRVYLKNPPSTSYYAANPVVPVTVGFLGPGESADEAIDFTAPQGYKELCVVINSQEYCGFGQVTTDIGIDILTENYVQDQIQNTQITTEQECVSGTPGTVPAFSLNPQTLIEGALTPEIAFEGIVRICASQNPGTGLTGEAATRWVDVGFCGDQNLRCYLDTESASEQVQTLDAINDENTIEQLQEQAGVLNQVEFGLDFEHSNAILDASRKGIGNLETTSQAIIQFMFPIGTNPTTADEIFSNLTHIYDLQVGSQGGTNNQQAESINLQVLLYRLITLSHFDGVLPQPEPAKPVDEEEIGIEISTEEEEEETLPEDSEQTTTTQDTLQETIVEGSYLRSISESDKGILYKVLTVEETTTGTILTLESLTDTSQKTEFISELETLEDFYEETSAEEITFKDIPPSGVFLLTIEGDITRPYTYTKGTSGDLLLIKLDLLFSTEENAETYGATTETDTNPPFFTKTILKEETTLLTEENLVLYIE